MFDVMALTGDTTSITMSEATTNMLDIASSVLEFIKEEPLLFTVFCSSLIFIGIGIFKGIKKAAKK